jgi:hypothetical protein
MTALATHPEQLADTGGSIPKGAVGVRVLDRVQLLLVGAPQEVEGGVVACADDGGHIIPIHQGQALQGLGGCLGPLGRRSLCKPKTKQTNMRAGGPRPRPICSQSAAARCRTCHLLALRASRHSLLNWFPLPYLNRFHPGQAVRKLAVEPPGAFASRAIEEPGQFQFPAAFASHQGRGLGGSVAEQEGNQHLAAAQDEPAARDGGDFAPRACHPPC